MRKLFAFLWVHYIWTIPVVFILLWDVAKTYGISAEENIVILSILSSIPCIAINLTSLRQPSPRLAQEERKREQSQQKIPQEMRKSANGRRLDPGPL